MNPLSIDMQNFICAEDLSSGALVGFGQVRRASAMRSHVAKTYRCKNISFEQYTTITRRSFHGWAHTCTRHRLLQADSTAAKLSLLCDVGAGSAL